MRHLNTFLGNSRGRNLLPVGITFGAEISTDCSLDPNFYANAYSIPTRVVGVSNTINLEISGPGAAGEIVTLWYRVNATQQTTPGPRSPPSSNSFTQISFSLSGLATISGITNGHWIQFGVEAPDPYLGLEFYTSTVRVSNVTPGITLGSFSWLNYC
jgi:hypothetical protein